MNAVDLDYDNGRAVPDRDEILAHWRVRSDAVAARIPHRELAYGPTPEERLDVFPGRPGAPAVVFFHGGWWRASGKVDTAFIARGLTAHGITFVNVDYALAPNVRLETIVAQARAAVAFVRREATALAIDPHKIVIAGHSAGGHLAAMCAVDTPSRALVSISGLHDLRPLVDAFVNDWLALDDERAAALSPALYAPAAPLPVVAVAGERELPGFHFQAAALGEAWQAHGSPTRVATTPGDHHFSIVERLENPDDPLTGVLVAAAG